MNDFSKFLPFERVKQNWQKALATGVCLLPLIITLGYEHHNQTQRRDTLTQIFNIRNTDERFRPYIERVVIDKIAACDNIPNMAETRELTAEETQLFIQECNEAQTRIAENFEFHQK